MRAIIDYSKFKKAYIKSIGFCDTHTNIWNAANCCIHLGWEEKLYTFEDGKGKTKSVNAVYFRGGFFRELLYRSFDVLF